jgi:hypothetical protein
VNGTPLSMPDQVALRNPIFCFSEDGEHILVTGEHGTIQVRDVHNLVGSRRRTGAERSC